MRFPLYFPAEFVSDSRANTAKAVAVPTVIATTSVKPPDGALPVGTRRRG